MSLTIEIIPTWIKEFGLLELAAGNGPLPDVSVYGSTGD